jgi:hypothetical protein
MKGSGTPLNVTIEEYKKLKKEVKDNYSDQILLINKTDADDQAALAIRLKEQLIAMGLSAEEAAERTRQQGKEPDPREHKKKLKRVPKKIRNKKNYIDTLTLVERRKIEEGHIFAVGISNERISTLRFSGHPSSEKPMHIAGLLRRRY